MPDFTLISVIQLKYVGLDVPVITLQECLCDSLHTMQAGLRVVEAVCEKVYHFVTSSAFSVFDKFCELWCVALEGKTDGVWIVAVSWSHFYSCFVFFTLLKVLGCDLKSWQDQLWMAVPSHSEISHIWVSQIQKFSKPAKLTCVLCCMWNCWFQTV